MTFLPSQVIIEPTSACNLSCKGCAFHGPERFVNRPVGMMKDEIWRKAISEIGSWGRQVNLTTHGGGEPLLYPKLKQILRFAKSFPTINVGFLTNGMLLNEDWSEFIISLGIDSVAFSIDGVNPETHRIVRQKSDLDVIENNLNAFLEMKKKAGAKKPAVMLNMVAYDEVKDQQEPFVERWIEKVSGVMISHYRNPPKSKRWPLVPEKRKPCYLLWSQMVIGWDGRLGLCCEDFDIDFPLGRVGERALEELWNGPEISEVRAIHEAGDFDLHPMCRVCDTWANDIVLETRDDDRGYKVITRASQTVYMTS